jgi:hypothetical protein
MATNHGQPAAIFADGVLAPPVTSLAASKTFTCHAIFWFFLYIAWHCGKLFLSIPQVWQSKFSFLFQPP